MPSPLFFACVGCVTGAEYALARRLPHGDRCCITVVSSIHAAVSVTLISSLLLQ
ncbi:MAG: hypothetical protein KatS3mg045_1867 [Bellilinea sp.]|jgi:hypothetical protein|nr:MAG: hypothetical protein KatS3mg045_1867 [Bellilinea sp.]